MTPSYIQSSSKYYGSEVTKQDMKSCKASLTLKSYTIVKEQAWIKGTFLVDFFASAWAAPNPSMAEVRYERILYGCKEQLDFAVKQLQAKGFEVSTTPTYLRVLLEGDGVTVIPNQAICVRAPKNIEVENETKEQDGNTYLEEFSLANSRNALKKGFSTSFSEKKQHISVKEALETISKSLKYIAMLSPSIKLFAFDINHVGAGEKMELIQRIKNWGFEVTEDHPFIGVEYSDVQGNWNKYSHSFKQYLYIRIPKPTFF